MLAGTQHDDLSDDPPGFRATQEAGVKSPLLIASFSKADVRETARVLGLSVWDKPAMPCLSSRINHGEEVTTDKLGMIGQAELYIKELTAVRNLRRSEEHTSELQSRLHIVCRLLLEKKKAHRRGRSATRIRTPHSAH